MPIVNIPGAGLVRFPDDMSDQDIGVAIRQDILPTVQKSGFTAGLSGGIESLKGAALAAKYGVTGSEADRQALLESQAKANEKYQGVGFDDVTEAFKERGVMAGLGRTWEAAKGTLGQSLPFMAAPVVGAAVAPAAIPAGIAGLSAGAIGFAAPSLVQYTGTGLARQVEEQEAAKARGETPQELSVGKAALASIPATVLDRFALGKTFKGTGLGKLFGEEGKDAVESIARKVVDTGADPSKFKSILAGGGRGIAAEIPNEVGQQILERAQAGLSLTNDDAIREYKEAAFGATLLGGPFGGASGMSMRNAGVNTAANWEQRAIDETVRYNKQQAQIAEAARLEQSGNLQAANEMRAAILAEEEAGMPDLIANDVSLIKAQKIAENPAYVDLAELEQDELNQVISERQKTGIHPATGDMFAPQMPKGIITPQYLTSVGVPKNKNAVRNALQGLDLKDPENVTLARQKLEAIAESKAATAGVAANLLESNPIFKTVEMVRDEQNKENAALAEQARQRRNQQLEELRKSLVLPEVTNAPKEKVTAPGAEVGQPSTGVSSEAGVQNQPVGPEPSVDVYDAASGQGAAEDRGASGRALGLTEPAAQERVENAGPVGNTLTPEQLRQMILEAGAEYDQQKAAEAKTIEDEQAKWDAMLEAEGMGAELEPIPTEEFETDAEAAARRKQERVDQRNMEAPLTGELSWGAGDADFDARQVAAPAPVQGMDKGTVQGITDRLTQGWKRGVNVVVKNIADETPGRQNALRAYGLDTAKGYIDHDGTVVILAENNKDEADVSATLFHEALGHLGLRLKFKEELTNMMEKFYHTNADLKRAANKWLLDHKGEYDDKMPVNEKYAKAVEEVLAERAEAGRLPASIMDKIKAFINKWARKAGLNVDYSDAEVRAILDQAQQEVTEKKGEAKTAPTALAPRAATSSLDELYQQAGGYTPTAATTRAAAKIKGTIDSFSTMEKVVDKINDVRTKVFSADTKFNARLTKALKNAGLDWKELRLTASMSQALHRGGLAERFLEWGNLSYDNKENRWDSKRDDVNIVAMGQKIREIADSLQVDPIAMKGFIGEAWVSKRLENINQEIAALEKEIDAFETPKTKGARQYQSSRTEKLELLQRVSELRTPEQLAAGLELYNRIGADNMKALNDMKNTLRERVLKMLVDTQVMTKDMAETFLENAEWVPFYRVTDEDGSVGGPAVLSKGLSEQMKEKKLKGATGVDDTKQVSGVDNLVKWLDWSVRRAVSNQQKLVMVDQFKQFVSDEIHEGKGETGYTISVMEDGREKFYHFDDPLIADAFTGMLPVMVPGMKGWRAATEGLRKAITRFPLFPVAQVVQDTYDAMFTSGLKHPTKVLTGVLKEIFRTYKGTSTARETLMGRGILSRDYSAAAEQEAAEVLAGLKDQNWWEKLNMNLERFSSTADHVVRQAVYNQAKAEGLSEREAVEKATEIINFRRQGSATWVNWMRTMVPFFGAYLQVQNVALKTLSGEGISPTERKAALATLGMTAAKIALFSTVYSMMVGDDDEYKDLDRRTRDRMILIPGTSVGIAIRPNVFATPKIFAEHAYGYLSDNGTTDGTKFRAAAKAALVDSVLPSSYAVPQLVRPALEVAMDHNIFLDKPIVGNLKNLEKYEQFTSSTSELGRLLGSSPLSPLSPVQWDHLLRGYFSSVGSMAMLATNDALAAAAGRPRPEKSWQDTINSIPNMGNFVTKEFGSGDKTDFYELAGEVEKVNNTVNRLKAQGRGEEIEGYLTEEKQQLLSLKKPIANIQKQLAAIRKQKNAVLQSQDMTAAEKADAMRELNEAEKEVVKGRTKELREAAGF